MGKKLELWWEIAEKITSIINFDCDSLINRNTLKIIYYIYVPILKISYPYSLALFLKSVSKTIQPVRVTR